MGRASDVRAAVQFNTTTSLGRLTLNVLLTSKRIRGVVEVGAAAAWLATRPGPTRPVEIEESTPEQRLQPVVIEAARETRR
jgi:hypothetical protein